MTNEDLKKLERLSNLIESYNKFMRNIDAIKIGFGHGNYTTDINLNSETSLLRREEIKDAIYCAVSDTLEDLKDKYNSILLCTKETNTKYKEIEL